MSIIKQIGTILAINGDGYGIQTHEIMPWKGIELDHFSKPPKLTDYINQQLNFYIFKATTWRRLSDSNARRATDPLSIFKTEPLNHLGKPPAFNFQRTIWRELNEFNY